MSTDAEPLLYNSTQSPGEPPLDSTSFTLMSDTAAEATEVLNTVRVVSNSASAPTFGAYLAIFFTFTATPLFPFAHSRAKLFRN